MTINLYSLSAPLLEQSEWFTAASEVLMIILLILFALTMLFLVIFIGAAFLDVFRRR